MTDVSQSFTGSAFACVPMDVRSDPGDATPPVMGS